MMQQTIINPISCYGIGVHSGQKTQITFKPAPEDTGIVFIRTDVKGVDNYIPASYGSVCETMLSTTIGNIANVKVSTIEHLMAAVWGCGVDNLFIEIDGPEVPIMDGSSKPFVFMFACAGLRSLNTPKRRLKLLKEIRATSGDSEIYALPSEQEQTRIDLTINFRNPVIGEQSVTFCNNSNFATDVADSRTFGFTQELDYLRSKGLAKGASLDNAIGISADNYILNHDGLRRPDEFVRHKLIDFLGDMRVCGGQIIGLFTAYKPGHDINNQFLRKVFSDPYAYKWI